MSRCLPPPATSGSRGGSKASTPGAESFRRHWRASTPVHLGTSDRGNRSHPDDLSGSVAIATVARMTGGNFRLVDRILTQIQNIRDINNLNTITPEVVELSSSAAADPERSSAK